MTSWVDAIAPEPQPAPEQVLIRWAVKLGRLTRWPHPARPWLQRRIAELLLVSAEFRRLQRALDEIAEDARVEAQAAEAMSHTVRKWREKERH